MARRIPTVQSEARRLKARKEISAGDVRRIMQERQAVTPMVTADSKKKSMTLNSHMLPLELSPS